MTTIAKKILSVLILAVLSSASLYARELTPPLTEEEKYLWRQAQAEQAYINASGFLFQDPELDAYLNEVVAKIKPPDSDSRLSFKVYALKNPFLNAFAYPDGTIYIHTGMLARMENEAQLSGILAHEMAHCLDKHALKSLQHYRNAPGIKRGIETLFRGLIYRLPFLNTSSFPFLFAGYTQELEAEADIKGLELMISAGYHPEAALDMFEHARQELILEKIDESTFFGTHPKLQQRIDNCKNYLQSYQQTIAAHKTNKKRFLEKTLPIVLENSWLDVRAGRFKAALQGAEKYLAYRSNDARGKYLLGEIYRQMGHDQHQSLAMGYYLEAIKADPQFPEPHKAVGLISFKQGDKTTAKQHFQAYLALKPQAPEKAYFQEYIKQCRSE